MYLLTLEHEKLNKDLFEEFKLSSKLSDQFVSNYSTWNLNNQMS